MKNLPQLRYYLEIISVPVFAWLIIHLSGHGLMLLKDHDHNHSTHNEHHVEKQHEEKTLKSEAHEADHDEHEQDKHEAETLISQEDSDHEDEHESTIAPTDEHDDHGHGELSLDYLLSTEVLGGLLALLFFTWLWHQKPLKTLVPCSHDHCHHKTVWPHVAATIAFVFHWFPESAVRHELLHDFDWHSLANLAGAIGFASHFLVDFIVMILLITFWPQWWQRLALGAVMVVAWGGSFWLGENGGLGLEGVAEPIVLLVSAFLLAMFVHKPHKPEPVCKTCTH